MDPAAISAGTKMWAKVYVLGDLIRARHRLDHVLGTRFGHSSVCRGLEQV